MRVTCFEIGPMPTNCYVVDNGREALCVDPGGDPAPVMDFLKKEGLQLLAILLTHRHFDHMLGIAALQKALEVPCLVPAGDSVIKDDEVARGGIWGIPEVPPFSCQELPAAKSLPGGVLGIGDFTFQILDTPGHTPGHVSFYFPEAKAVLDGDTLFCHTIGRSDFTFGSQEQLLASIRDVLFKLPDETVVYSGHGPESTIGAEKPIISSCYGF